LETSTLLKKQDTKGHRNSIAFVNLQAI